MMMRKCHNPVWLVILISFSVCFVLLSLFDNSDLISGRSLGFTCLLTTFTKPNVTVNYENKTMDTINKQQPLFENQKHISNSDSDSCLGRYIYVHNLPSRFNDDLLKNCQSLSKWVDMCPYMENYGLGPQVENPGGVLLNDSWFSTNQFSLEVIIGNKMKQYECLTNDSSIASAIYVPYYAGLDIGRYLWDYNISVRDSSALDIAKWLVEKPEWKRMLGRDHFFVAGRIGWDFRRKRDKNSDWGSKLMSLPEFMNMSMLSIESTFWSNEYAIPYPTYFHPRSQNEIVEWQHKMTSRKRNHLLSFAGAPRPTLTDSIRGEIMKQCLSSGTSCKLLDCSSSSSSDGKNKCENPVEVIKVFGDSVFCLQPSGDSYTRRSTFDSILAGCIPVFFHPGSAYAQYTWYFPKNYTKYSVYIPEDSIKGGKVNITEILIGVSEEEILAMREEVIRLIPKIVYGDPRWSAGVVDQKLEEDAFYIAVRGILERIENVRRRIKDIGFAQEYHDF